ncbi:response regulator transcription factor [Lentzea sp.]|uniref:response regulator transcription factor n=1 Tax=Lentzea sp. TaxID=56099 RepID=UPI002ED4BF34
MIRVVLADDEPVVRFGVKAVLGTAGDIEVVAEAENGSAVIDLVARYRPDVAVLDIRMPVLDGLDAARVIRECHPATHTLVLTTFADDAYISRALGEGAAGFVLKTGDPAEIVSGVRAVASGGAYLSPSVAKRVVEQVSRARPLFVATQRIAGLTYREREVLGLVGAGLSNAEIAARIHVVEGTVKVYVSTILRELGVKNRVQAAIIAHESGIIPG